MGRLRLDQRSKSWNATPTSSAEGRALWTCVSEYAQGSNNTVGKLLHRNSMLVNIMLMFHLKRINSNPQFINAIHHHGMMTIRKIVGTI